MNPNKDNDYVFRFTPAAVATTCAYYAGRIFLVPYLGFLAPLGAVLARNRRVWFGLATAALLPLPLLRTPSRPTFQGNRAPAATFSANLLYSLRRLHI